MMIARLRSWWQKISKTLDAAIVSLLVILLVLLVLIILGYSFNWSWTGLHGKTLYDWLQLLIIPAVLAIGGYLFNYTTGRNERHANEQRAQTEREAAEKRSQTERDIASDNQREAALQAYLDKMSELLLEKNLRESRPEDEVRKIATVRTLTVLPRLDSMRKRSVLLFLYEAGLIDRGKNIIDLSAANLMMANLSDAYLCKAGFLQAYLESVDLRGADLREAYFVGTRLGTDYFGKAYVHGLSKEDILSENVLKANLSGADLSGTEVTQEQLDQARSLKGAIMPDGTKHV